MPASIYLIALVLHFPRGKLELTMVMRLLLETARRAQWRTCWPCTLMVILFHKSPNQRIFSCDTAVRTYGPRANPAESMLLIMASFLH